MKRLYTGLIILDRIDIICISFSAGSIMAYGVKRYRNYRKSKIKGEDPIVNELKRKSPIRMFSKKGKPLKLPLMKGYDRIRGYSLVLENKKLAQILEAIIYAKKKQKMLIVLQDVLFILNTLLTSTTGFRIATGGSLDYTQILLIAFPSTIACFLMATMYTHPLVISILPMAILFGRGIEGITHPFTCGRCGGCASTPN